MAAVGRFVRRPYEDGFAGGRTRSSWPTVLRRPQATVLPRVGGELLNASPIFGRSSRSTLHQNRRREWSSAYEDADRGVESWKMRAKVRLCSKK